MIDTKKIELVTRSPLYSLLSLTLNGLVTVRAYQQGPVFINKFMKLLNDNTNAKYHFWNSSRGFGVAIDFTSSCCVTAGLCVLISNQQPNAGLQGMSISYLLMISEFVQYVLRQALLTTQLMSSTARIINYTELKTEANLTSAKDQEIVGEWPKLGSIEFNNTYMRYRENLDPVINGLTASVLPGQKIGCVGRSGAGKSSIIQLLFRMTEIDKSFPNSYVKIDGVDTSEIGLHLLRNNISIIPQVPFMFTGSIRRNLDPFFQKSAEELWNSLEEVNLKETVNALPMKLDTDMSHATSVFSVGQKQLICLARAILKKNKILVLDEATANVDLETDNFIQRKIMERFSDCTIFTIAHRLSTVANYDKIMVMDKGRLVEFDAPLKLLVNNEEDDNITKQGFFASMVLNTGPRTSKTILNLCKAKLSI
jgi:ATP-binding cassette subfamily C (CFTR/MRP) protein 4